MRDFTRLVRVRVTSSTSLPMSPMPVPHLLCVFVCNHQVEEKKMATDALLEEMGVQRADAEVQQAAASVEAEKVH